MDDRRTLLFCFLVLSFVSLSLSVLQTEEDEQTDAREFIAYSCWTEEDLLARQNKKAKRVAEVLCLTFPLATVLLRYFEWNVDKLYAQYLKQPEQVLRAAGVKVQASESAAQAKNCLICDEPPSAVRVENFLSCGHRIVRVGVCLKGVPPHSNPPPLQCVDCWVQYLTVKVQTGDVNSVRCPAYKCTALVPDDVVERLLEAELVSKYRRWVLRGFLSRSHSARWCPKRDCSNVIRAPADAACVVRCLCGHLFCFGCGDEAHYPTTCMFIDGVGWCLFSSSDMMGFFFSLGSSVKAWRAHYTTGEQDARAMEWFVVEIKKKELFFF